MKRIEDDYFNKVIRPLAETTIQEKKYPKFKTMKQIHIPNDVESKALEEAVKSIGSKHDLLEIKKIYFSKLKEKREYD